MEGRVVVQKGGVVSCEGQKARYLCIYMGMAV